jgi:hypothetical protein
MKAPFPWVSKDYGYISLIINHSLLKSLPAVSIFAVRGCPVTETGDGSALSRQFQNILLNGLIL